MSAVKTILRQNVCRWNDSRQNDMLPIFFFFFDSGRKEGLQVSLCWFITSYLCPVKNSQTASKGGSNQGTLAEREIHRQYNCSPCTKAGRRFSTDKLRLKGQNLGRVFNFRYGHAHSTWTSFRLAKLPSLKWKTWPKQLLGSLLLAFAFPRLKLDCPTDCWCLMLVEKKLMLFWSQCDWCSLIKHSLFHCNLMLFNQINKYPTLFQ